MAVTVRRVLRTVAVGNYRSLRELVLPLSRLNLVTGPNGCGKSNLYRALRLLAEASRNGAVASLAREGGLPSTLWAGPEYLGRAVREGRAALAPVVRTRSVGLRLGFAGDEFGYALDLGFPIPGDTLFNLDPEFKRECVWAGTRLRPSSLLADRAGPVVRTRDDTGRWNEDTDSVRLTDSMISEFADPRRCPELLLVRERVRSWRFYDQFRTDTEAPARQPTIGTRTPVLAHDGADLCAAVATIQEIGDADALDTAVEGAFPGARLEIAEVAGRFELRWHQHGLLRPLNAPELSDGTLRYLMWVAALLTPRPPELMVLNEPETSLHPDLLPALAGLIATASQRTQVIVVSHSRPLLHAVEAVVGELNTEASTLALRKELGETTLIGQDLLQTPSWHWPKR